MELTRAERIEEYKSLIESEIETLRAVRDVTTDALKWEDLDQEIDALYIRKDNAAAEIDAALENESDLPFWPLSDIVSIAITKKVISYMPDFAEAAALAADARDWDDQVTELRNQ